MTPLLGRLPTADDAKPGAAPVFVLSDRGWGQHFNRDPAVVGKSFVPVFQLCSEGYFPTLRLKLERGRSLSLADIEGSRHVAVVSELLARMFFKNENPIGQTIKFNVLDQLPQSPRDAYFEIIGISSDAKNQGLQDPPLPEAFVPYAITGFFNRGCSFGRQWTRTCSCRASGGRSSPLTQMWRSRHPRDRSKIS